MGDNKVRILFILPALVAGGAERVVLTLLRNLSRAKFDISFAAVSFEGAVLANELPSDIPIFDFKSPRLRSAVRKIVTHLWKYQPDIVFSTLDYLNVGLGLTRPLWPRHTKLIARPAILFSANLKTRRNPRIWRISNTLALSNTDCMVFQSSAMEQDFRSALNWHDGVAVVIQNPLDFEIVRERSIQRVNTDLNPSKFNLIAAGRLEEQKGFDLAIEAVALTEDKNVVLTILGNGSLRHSLEEQAKARGVQDRVKLLGYTPNPFPYYAQADGLLLSSRFEGFPNVVLEALACGTAVVATPVAGLSSLLEKFPECRLSADYTPVGLAEAIDDFASRGRRRVSSDAVSTFDAKNVVAEYEKMFVKICFPRCWA